MSCVLWDSEVRPLDRAEIAVVVDGRVATVTETCHFLALDEADAQTFADVLPGDAAVTGLRWRDGGGPWQVATAGPVGTPADLPDGTDTAHGLPPGTYVVGLPEIVAGDRTVEVTWQRVLAADGGRLAVGVPLTNPVDTGPATFSATLDVDGVPTDAWEGTRDDASTLAFSWTVEPAPLGVQIYAYHPATDPFTGEPGDGYALAVLSPGPVDEGRVDEVFAFVVDLSGSMAGAPRDAAVDAARTWLADLGPDDRFDVLAYQSQAWPFRGRPPHATSDEVAAAVRFLDRQDPMGLSDPDEALVSTLSLLDDAVSPRTFFGCDGSAREADGPPVRGEPIRPVADVPEVAPYVVWLTDGGASAGETRADVIASDVTAADVVGASIFAIGVGPDVDRELLEEVTSEHRGEVAYAEGADDVAAAVEQLRAHIADPMLVRPTVAVPGTEAAPAVLPDVAGGREIVVAFRFSGGGDESVHLSAVRGREVVDLDLPVTLPLVSDDHPEAARAWAQLRIADLDAAYGRGDAAAYDEIVELVERYGVSSAYYQVGWGDDTGAGSGLWAEDKAAGCGCRTEPALAGGLPLGIVALVALRRRRATGPALPTPVGGPPGAS